MSKQIIINGVKTTINNNQINTVLDKASIIIKDDQIDTSDIPEVIDWSEFKLSKPKVKKKQISLKLDPKLIDFYKQKNPNYQTYIRRILESYAEHLGY